MTDLPSSGVRNLRAMFENQNSASSPEPRGRSPAGNGLSDGTVRPTSKVRASFVSVESNNPIARDLGTTKGVSVNSPQAHRRESFSISDALGEEVPAELKRVVSEEKVEREKSASIAEAVPEQAVATRESSRAPPPIRKVPDDMPNLGSIMKGSDFPEPAATEAAQPGPRKAEKRTAGTVSADAPGDSQDGMASGVQEVASLPPPTKGLPSSSSAQVASETPKSSASALKTNGTGTTPGKAVAKKPTAILTPKASTTKGSSAKSPLPKSPGLARLPKTPTTSKPTPAATARSPAPTKAQPKTVTAAPVTKTTRTSLRPSTATAATTASTAAKPKATTTEVKKPVTSKPTTASSKESTTTSPGGFKKPRPKSPTRPVRLPSHLTAPTAASAAKHGEDAATQKVVRKPSTISRSSPKAAPAAKRQPSRASLAPSAATTKRPESRASTKGTPDDGFLARMMRPTASSASKTHPDKPTSPPRKTVAGRAPAKPKGPESITGKSKKKTEEVASKAEDTIPNGHSEEIPVEPTIVEPATTESAANKPTVAEPAAVEPVAVEPVAVEPTTDEPAIAEPTVPEPASAEPTVSESVDTEPLASEPVADGGAVDEPIREATPVEQIESSAVELQTPNFEGQTIR